MDGIYFFILQMISPSAPLFARRYFVTMYSQPPTGIFAVKAPSLSLLKQEEQRLNERDTVSIESVFKPHSLTLQQYGELFYQTSSKKKPQTSFLQKKLSKSRSHRFSKKQPATLRQPLLLTDTTVQQSPFLKLNHPNFLGFHLLDEKTPPKHHSGITFKASARNETKTVESVSATKLPSIYANSFSSNASTLDILRQTDMMLYSLPQDQFNDNETPANESDKSKQRNTREKLEEFSDYVMDEVSHCLQKHCISIVRYCSTDMFLQWKLLSDVSTKVELGHSQDLYHPDILLVNEWRSFKPYSTRFAFFDLY